MKDMSINYSAFPTYIPIDRQEGLHEVISLSGGRSSADALMQLINGGFGDPEFHHVVFDNTGKEDETCYKFLSDIEQCTNLKINWLEYTLTNQFTNELIFSSFSYDKFNRCEYTSIGQILDIKKLRSFKFEKSPNSFWYKQGFSDRKLNIKEVDYLTASRNGKPFTDLFLYKCAIRIMKGQGIILPSVGQRWCTGDGKEKVTERWLANKGITEYISYKGMRFDEPDRVDRVMAKNKVQDKIWYDCPLHHTKTNKIDVLMSWSGQPFDLGLKNDKTNCFYDVIGNCDYCHLKTLLKKMWLVQNGFDIRYWKQIELIANNYNGDVDAMSRQHGTYEQIEKKALEIEPISLSQILSDAEVQISCTNCTD